MERRDSGTPGSAAAAATGRPDPPPLVRPRTPLPEPDAGRSRADAVLSPTSCETRLALPPSATSGRWASAEAW